MPRPRKKLHDILCGITGDTKIVYYQPPMNVKMTFPCIEYHDAPWDTKFAGDSPYAITRHYQVTVIDPRPENPWIFELATLPMCTQERHYVSDGLNHDVFDLYY